MYIYIYVYIYHIYMYIYMQSIRLEIIRCCNLIDYIGICNNAELFVSFYGILYTYIYIYIDSYSLLPNVSHIQLLDIL